MDFADPAQTAAVLRRFHDLSLHEKLSVPTLVYAKLRGLVTPLNKEFTGPMANPFAHLTPDPVAPLAALPSPPSTPAEAVTPPLAEPKN